MESRKSSQSGFTLIEVLVISPVLIFTIVITLSYLFNLYGQLTQQASQLNLQSDAQTILFSIQDDLTYAREFSTAKYPSLSDAYAPSGGWTSQNTNPARVIILVPATTASHRSPDRQTVYLNEVGCTPDVDLETMQSNSLAFHNIIYFVNGSNLYKRTLSPSTGTAMCGTPYLRQSCPAANATSTCPADKLISSQVNAFTATYYDSANNIISSPSAAQRVRLNIQLKDRAYAEDIYANSSITVKRLN